MFLSFKYKPIHLCITVQTGWYGKSENWTSEIVTKNDVSTHQVVFSIVMLMIKYWNRAMCYVLYVLLCLVVVSISSYFSFCKLPIKKTV